MYSICTLPKRTYTVHILYIYCTNAYAGGWVKRSVFRLGLLYSGFSQCLFSTVFYLSKSVRFSDFLGNVTLFFSVIK